MTPPPEIGVIGLGNWGTALANHLAKKGNAVLGWSVEPEVVNGVNSNHKNPKYLSDTVLSANFRATSKLDDVLASKFIVLVVPAAALTEVVPKLKVTDDTVIVSAIKGLDHATSLTPIQFMEKNLPCKPSLAVLSGPSFALDIVAGRPCGVVAACRDEAVARRVAETFSGDSMRAYISTDTLGVELGGIVKNIIALAAGICDGIGHGESARAGLITRGLAEMVRLAEAVGVGDVRTLYGLSGLGDLAMTATSTISRNHIVGIRLGRGEKLQDIVTSLGSVAEGVTTTPHVLNIARKFGVEMPITEQVSRVLSGEITPLEATKYLISRPLKREFL